jgi:hypothetical protein
MIGCVCVVLRVWLVVCVRVCVCLSVCGGTQSWLEFFMYMDGLRAEEGCTPDIQDLCVRVCGSLLHPSRRQVLMPIWDLRTQVTQPDFLARVETALAGIQQRNTMTLSAPPTTSV